MRRECDVRPTSLIRDVVLGLYQGPSSAHKMPYGLTVTQWSNITYCHKKGTSIRPAFIVCLWRNKLRPASFRETLPVVKTSPECVTVPEQGKSSGRIATFSLWTGMFRDKLLEYKRNWIQHVNRMPRNRLPRVMKHYSPTGRRNHGRPLRRLLDTWDRNGSTSGPTPRQIDDDDDTTFVWNISHSKDVFM